MRLLARLAVLLLFACAAPVPAETRWSLVATYPHDPAAFTQGLLVHDGLLYESTGLVGQSEIRAVRLKDGKVLRRIAVPPPYFGEGLALWKDRLVSITWRHGTGFVWRLRDFQKIGQFPYDGEGWGIASDGKRLVMSDGTADLRFLDPDTLKETGRINVHMPDGRQMALLNELEVVDGEILANVWMTNQILRIDPATGLVIDWIDLSDLVRRVGEAGAGSDDVLNGIAWDAANKRLFVTGKNWPKLFEIKLEK